MDDHLGRDIRHDDLYEELAPTTHCKFNKKTHSHSWQLSCGMRMPPLTPPMNKAHERIDHTCGWLKALVYGLRVLRR